MNWFSLGKVVVFRQKVVLSGQIGCILAKWFYLGKLGLIGETGSIWAKGGCIWAN